MSFANVDNDNVDTHKRYDHQLNGVLGISPLLSNLLQGIFDDPLDTFRGARASVEEEQHGHGAMVFCQVTFRVHMHGQSGYDERLFRQCHGRGRSHVDVITLEPRLFMLFAEMFGITIESTRVVVR